MAEAILDLFSLFGPVPPRGAEPGVDALRAMHQKHGVAGALTLSTRGIYHSAAAGNRETQKMCSESNNTLLPVSVLDPRQPGADSALAGGRALAAFPATQEWPVAYLPLISALKALAGRGAKAPLLFETARIGDATALDRVIGESGYTGPIVLIGIHGALLGEAFALAERHQQVAISTDTLRGIGEVDLAVENLGPDRVVFGSGALARNAMGASLAIVRAARLAPDILERVLCGNARRLLAAGGTL